MTTEVLGKGAGTPDASHLEPLAVVCVFFLFLFNLINTIAYGHHTTVLGNNRTAEAYLQSAILSHY